MANPHSNRKRTYSGSDAVIEWETPDDITLQFAPAGLGARLGAVVFDTVLIVTCLVLFGFTAFYAGLFTGSAVPLLLVLLGSLFLRVGYWIWTEWRWFGQTIGKSLAGIQVLNADGQPLRLSAVVTRNLLREVEFWIPASVLYMLLSGYPTEPLLLWCLGFLVIPFVSTTNRRLGDVVAGTVVIESPDPVSLNQDLLDHAAAGGERSYAFRNEMLDVYGIVQLNALQDALENRLHGQNGTAGNDNSATLQQIKDRVVEKIDFPDPVPDREAVPFLTSFYRAMRRHLEGKLASGEALREEIKEDVDSRSSSHLVERLAEKYRLPERDRGRSEDSEP